MEWNVIQGLFQFIIEVECQPDVVVSSDVETESFVLTAVYNEGRAPLGVLSRDL